MATYYLDYVSGNDATTATPLGWWSVAYTGGDRAAGTPTAGETVTGGTSTSTATITAVTVSSGTFAGGDAAGTMYFYGKSAAFVAEQLNFGSSGHCHIAADFTYCAWKTITSGATAARIAPGDVVRIAKSTDATSMGQNATWTDNSTTITLTSSVTANIDDGETAWTASPNVTCTADTSYYTEGSKSSKIAIATGFTTGLAAYKAFGSTDFSSYQQISLAIRPSASISTSGYLQIKLCSDALGVTAVNTIDIPALSDNKWAYVTVDTGGALGAAIQSVALYTTNDFGARDIYIDNIIACKASSSADSLTLNSLISKNSLSTGGSEPWLPIRSINGTTVKIATYGASTTPANDRPYSGTSEAVTAYKRETIKLVTSDVSPHQVQESGTSSSVTTTYSGGWDKTTNTQNGETFYDAINGHMVGAVDLNQASYITLERVNAVRANYGIYTGQLTSSTVCIGNSITAHSLVGCSKGLHFEGRGGTISVTNASHNSSYGVDFLTSGTYCSSEITLTATNLNSNYAAGLSLHDVSCLTGTITNINRNAHGIDVDPGGPNNHLSVTNIKNNSTYGVYCYDYENPLYLYNTTFSGNGTAAFYYTRAGARTFIKSGTISDATKITFAKTFSPTGVYMTAYGGDTNDNRIYLEYGNIVSQTTTRHTASGIAWQMSPTNTLRGTKYPMYLSLAKIAVEASKLVTVKAWCKLSHASDIGAKLFCKGGQIAGVSSDVTDTKAADTSWEELSITFTPSEAGVVEILGQAYWLANAADDSVYWDDMTITQA